MSNFEIIICLLCIYVPTMFLIVFSFIRNTLIYKLEPKCKYIIQAPKITLLISLLGLIFVSLLLVGFTLFSYKTLHIVFYVCFGLFIFLFLYLYFKVQNCRVYVNDKEFCVQPMFRNRYYCKFDDIKYVKRQVKSNGAERVLIYFNYGKKLKIEKIQINYKEFLKSLTYNVSYDKLTGFESYYGNLTP